MITIQKEHKEEQWYITNDTNTMVVAANQRDIPSQYSKGYNQVTIHSISISSPCIHRSHETP